MGIYTNTDRFNTNNDVYDYASEIAANEAYDAAIGCAQILLDNQANDRALFESAIYNDVAEINAFYNEGVQVVNENAFTNFIKKIVEMFKKLLAKIKGIFMSVITRISTMVADGEKLVKKYDKVIQKCKDWEKFKVKDVRKPKEADVFTSIKNAFPFELSNDYSVKSGTITHITKIGEIGTVKEIEDMESEDIKKKVMTNYVKNEIDASKGTLHEELMDSLFENSDTFEASSSSDISVTWIKGAVDGKNKALTNVKDNAKKAENRMNRIISDLTKLESKLSYIQSDEKKANDTRLKDDELIGKHQHSSYDWTKEVKTKDKEATSTYKDNAKEDENGLNTVAEVQAYVKALNKVATVEQNVVATVTSEIIELYKFALAQGRKIYVAAARYASADKYAYKEKESKNEGVDYQDAVYINALAECVEEEFYMNMEAL